MTEETVVKTKIISVKVSAAQGEEGLPLGLCACTFCSQTGSLCVVWQ